MQSFGNKNLLLNVESEHIEAFLDMCIYLGENIEALHDTVPIDASIFKVKRDYQIF